MRLFHIIDSFIQSLNKICTFFTFYRSLEGRRIVNISHLFSQIQNSRHGKLECSFLDMEFLTEHRRGCSSTFKFRCKMCGIKSIITSENDQDSNFLSINKALVNGSIAIGTDFVLLYVLPILIFIATYFLNINYLISLVFAILLFYLKL